ncbi:hypothetical protein ACEWY4_027518 [Coilia grayii]|uniref:Reverse transcriptase domain-containing protein n=1 Tax=Coilia grayii TaxID=363190 RepID=A0ABD1IPG4_9TELE
MGTLLIRRSIALRKFLLNYQMGTVVIKYVKLLLMGMHVSLFLLFHLMACFHVATLNMNGARNSMKRMELFETMKQKNIDVMFLQETHSDDFNAADWLKEFKGTVVLSHNTANSGGVAVLFEQRCTPVCYHTEEILPGRLLKIRAQYENDWYVFICVYAPTRAIDRLLFLNTLSHVLSSLDSNEFLLIGGDFNCTELGIDRNHTEPHIASRRKLMEIMATYDLADVWRIFHLEQRQYTWAHSCNNSLSLARLDRFYSYKHHLSFYKNCCILPVGFSDHCMVLCNMSLVSLKPRSAYWHFNTALLEDNNFKEIFIYFWNNFRLEKAFYSTLQQWWDMAKIQTKQLCQQYTFNVTRDLTISQKSLEVEIMNLQTLIDTTNDQSHIEKIKIKKIQLRDLLEKKAQGALVRSRFRNVSEMDAPSKFFFGLEQKNGQKRLIHALRSDSGALLTETADIKQRATGFYSELFKCESVEDERLSDVFLSGLPKLKKGSAEKLDGALTLGELHAAVMGMANGRAPGLDGLPVEFYKVFWPVIGQDLLDVLNASVAGGKLPLSCRRAVLTLVPKKGDLTEIKQWRPLSLLCIDSRIFSKTLATRLGKVMEEIIHVDQTYCVPGRSIFDNICLVRDTLDVCRILQKKVGLLLIDQEKAFDRVEHFYLWKVLHAFGFNSGFIRMLKVMYSDIESLLKVNGGLCAPFKVNRGIRQGCSLSGMLYALSIEPLLHRLRAEMSGVSLTNGRTTLCLSAYADDLIIMVDQQKDINVLDNICREFGQLSSSKINWTKSEAILVGEWGSELLKLPEGLNWKRGIFKYLGVYLGGHGAVQKNWDGVLEKVKGRLNKWRWLIPQLSYKGRVLIINNLAASMLWHKFVCLDPPPRLITQIQALLIDFFWDKLHWIPQSVLYLPKEDGGQGLVHLASRGAAFRLQFIQRFLTGPEDLTWRELACEIFHRVGGLCFDKTLFLMDSTKLNISGLPAYYQGLFKIWNLFKTENVDVDVSLHWLLKEPLIHGARCDITRGSVASTMRLCKVGGTTLQQLVDKCGPEFTDDGVMVTWLGLRSARVMGQVLQELRSVLTLQEKTLLKDYAKGVLHPDPSDPFPNLCLTPKMEECDGPLLAVNTMYMNVVSGKYMYRNCVKILNKKWLNNRPDTPWRSVLMLKSKEKPEWGTLYKPPLTKKMGDLQWRVLHGIVATNSFVSVLNSEIRQDCPFSSQRETVFHAFMYCVRLCPLFALLQSLFQSLHVHFSKQILILGVKYSRLNKLKGELINFILGNAKMAIYISRKNKMEQDSDFDVLFVLLRLLRSRIQMDFNFYKATGNLDAFVDIYCYKETVCSVFGTELVFSPLLL